MCDFRVLERKNKQTKGKIYKGKFSWKINYFPVGESLAVTTDGKLLPFYLINSIFEKLQIRSLQTLLLSRYFHGNF